VKITEQVGIFELSFLFEAWYLNVNGPD